MCGINGIFDINNKYSEDELYSKIREMNDLIVHRGPDDDGYYVSAGAAIGMRRLSIIDLSGGKQPIFNKEKTMGIVFNGEIYNYKKLKAQLLQKGYIFETDSDTEVILYCFIEYGKKSFNMLNGMFAFSIIDLKNKELILVRDRAGEKPLYYFNSNGIFAFASELKSLVSLDVIDKKISFKALNQYLSLTYIPAPLTIYENVYKMMPGTYLEISKNGSVKTESYWNLKYDEKELITDYNTCKKMLRETLFNAVEETMISDVPVGTFLSGGIDSTIITGIASKIAGKKLDSFTIGFSEKEFDESDRAKIASNYHNTNHHIYYLNYDDAIKKLDTLLKNIDEPFADSSYIPTYMVSNFARQYVKTVLTGDSGDELFGGYSKYLIGYYSEKYNSYPKWTRYIFEKVLVAMPDKSTTTRKVKKVVENSNKTIYEQRENLMCVGFKKSELSRLLNHDLFVPQSLNLISEYYNSQESINDELSKALYTDFKVVLEGDMLQKVDRASMLASLETRVPMLHKDVIELSTRIPSKFKINSKNTKIILKDTFSDLIPKELFNASKKGFRVPIGSWFRNELKSDLLEMLDKTYIQSQNIFNYEYIEKILEQHFSMRRNRESEIWTLYVFQKWYRENLDV